MSEKRIDTAAEPVEHQDDEFMDTGVLHGDSSTAETPEESEDQGDSDDENQDGEESQ